MLRHFILIKNIKVQKANALSSPYTIGFPAITSWLGAVHALQRYVKTSHENLSEVKFKAVGITCHKFHLNIFKENYDNNIILSKNPPATRKDEKFVKNEKSQNKAFIPLATCDLDCSLLIEHNIQNNNWPFLREAVNKSLHAKIKIAGGDILSFEKVNEDEMFLIDEHDESELRKLTRKLMPSYLIKERRDLMIDSMKENNSVDAIDALLDHLKVTHSSEKDNEGNIYWEQNRKELGWIVPIATGFQGITEIKKVKGQRDFNVPHRFAESIVTLGEFIMPYRIQHLDEMLWHYCVNPDSNLYICQQKNNNN